jgi:hypothetical protein
MTAAAARKPAARSPSPLEAFIARAEARALLWHTGALDLHTAVDELWDAAMRDGLVAKLGPDKVQELLANAFAPQRDDLPSDREDQVATSDNLNLADDTWPASGWRDAAIEYHKDRGKNVSTVSYTSDELDRLRQLLDDDVSMESAWRQVSRPHGVPIATLLTAEFLLQQNNPQRFKTWLARHSREQRNAILEHLNKKQG